MEFEFIRNTLMGEYYVKCSMGHEIVGRWLQDEVGNDWQKIEQVEQLIVQALTNPQQEHFLLG
ncbi:YacL family protein, partial [Halomonas marinisediminis]